MITPLGKILRKLRVDRDERLLDMADKLGKSAAFISAIERGSKSPPSGFEEAVITAYDLPDAAAKELRQTVYQTRKSFSVEATTPMARDMVGLLARRMNSLSPDELIDIMQILNKKGGADNAD